MVRSAKRITRKDIRRPDLFVTFTGTLLRIVEKHRTAFVLSVTLIFIVLLGAWGWYSYTLSQNRLAAKRYSAAMVLYHNGRYRDALEALDAVKSFRRTPYASLASLYQANSHLALKEYGAAASAFREFLSRETDDPVLRQLGLLGLGYTQEKTGRCKEAAETFARAQAITGPLQEDALLAEARCQAEAGAYKNALDSYRRYLSSYPGSEKKTEISLKIQELEAKVEQSGGGK